MNIEEKQAKLKLTEMTVDAYHQRSKHSLNKYAAGPEGLDWDTQPTPYRDFKGSPRFSLSLPAKNLLVDFNDVFRSGAIKPAILDQNTISAFFELSLSLSAWKVHGSDRWALRVNPSSGNLHPTEAYLLYAGSNIIPAGVYHYHSYDHCLEQRCHLKTKIEELKTQLSDNSFIIGLSSIHWREAWKYGERAYRYCQHDIGHAITSLRYAAAVLGWHVELLEHASDEQIASLLGLDRNKDFENTETEVPDVLLLIRTTQEHQNTPNINSLIELVKQGEWKGQANCLSPDNRINWPVIDDISAICNKPATEIQIKEKSDYPALMPCETDFDAASIIRHRRSAQAFDGKTVMPLTQFYRMLDSLLDRDDTTPFDTLPWQPRIHLVLYVHRVEGLKPGLYVFPRSEAGKQLLKQKLREEFNWSRPAICPDSLPIYHLIGANCQNASRTISCHQAIASDSAFSISMLAEYKNTVEDKPWQYRQLFWEAGMIGQTLYLEAEAVTARATGIGCFFDDSVHETLGITDNELQVIYHFTVGTPVKDNRLITLPPYGHLNTD